MQIMSSLLRLQGAKIQDSKIQLMFQDSQHRIRSMAIIHEKLYESKDFSNINFAQYIQNIASHLLRTYREASDTIKIKTEVQNVLLDLNTAIPFGLIINELLSNSLKHAFPKGKKGDIIVKLSRNKQSQITLIVSDNGIGLKKDWDLKNPSTLGLQLVSDLAKQIDGTIELDRKGGTTFSITFESKG